MRNVRGKTLERVMSFERCEIGIGATIELWEIIFMMDMMRLVLLAGKDFSQ